MRPDEHGEDAFRGAFSAAVAEIVASDRSCLWIRAIGPGVLEYAASRVVEWEDSPEVEAIVVCVASPGGDLDEALALYSLFRSATKPTIAYVFWANSGGVLAALGCDYRIGFPTTTVLIHDPWISVQGRSDYIADHVQGVEIQRKLLQQILLERTKISQRKLRSIARKEWWMGYKDALRYGILTEEEYPGFGKVRVANSESSLGEKNVESQYEAQVRNPCPTCR